MTDPVLGVVAAGSGTVLYAFTLGLVAAVNPCGFPLLPAYLAVFVGEEAGGGWTRRTVRGLVAGSCLTAGFVVVFGGLGILVESGVHVVVGWVPWVMIPLGLAMTVVGLLTAVGRAPRMAVPVLRTSNERTAAGMVGFGIAYAVASLGCALPLFLAGVAGSFTRLGFATGAATFVAYALGMGLLVVAASLVAAHAGAKTLRRVRPLTRFVPRLAGAVLTLVGGYLVLYWTAYAVDPAATPSPVGAVEHLQALVSGWISARPRATGLVLGIVVLAALGATAFALRTEPRVEGRRAPEATVAAEAPAAPSTSLGATRDDRPGALGPESRSGRDLAWSGAAPSAEEHRT